MQYVKGNNSDRTLKAMEFYKCFEEEGFEKAYQKFFEPKKTKKLTEVF